MNKFFIKILSFVLLTTILGIPQNGKTLSNILDEIKSDSLKKHLYILADDSLEGRGVGTKGGNIAAKYIADQFAKYGLKKITASNNYFQNIPMHGSIPLLSSDLMLINVNDTIKFNLSKDYFLYRSGQQTFTPVPLPLVFVGYGIVAPEFDYNDYQTVDVEGKIVVYIDGEPHSNDENYFDGKIPTVYSYPESKRRIAISRGAAGTIQIPLSSIDDWKSIQNDFEFEDVTLAYSVSSNLSIILKPDLADVLLKNSGYSFKDVIEMYINNQIISFPLKAKLKFKGVFKERDFTSPNIIGMVEGNDPELKDSYIIISAHYDHLGIGSSVKGDSIYNGALDNAIGVSVLLELAKIFSRVDLETELKPKRSIIFIATTGEEKGLLGSSYYTDNPIIPLYKTIANINIDGVAMFKDFESIVGIGNEYSTLQHTLEYIAEKNNMIIENIPAEYKSYDAFNKSDQLAFAVAGIPSIIILEGTKNKTKNKDEVLNAFTKYFLEYYHKPNDDVNQNIDFEAAVNHARIIFDFCYSLANEKNAPEWKTGSPFINARLRSIAEKR
jgi:hypothetical protein